MPGPLPGADGSIAQPATTNGVLTVPADGVSTTMRGCACCTVTSTARAMTNAFEISLWAYTASV